MTGVEATGGSALTVGLALAGLVVALALAIAIAAKLVAGYRRSGDPAMGRLAAGLVLLTVVPIVLRLLFPTTAPALRSLTVSAAELGGLLVVLGVIYDAL